MTERELIREKFHQFLDGPLTELEFKEALKRYSEWLKSQKEIHPCNGN
jgi:hypothetical protein